MSVLFNKSARVVCQGFTDSQSAFRCGWTFVIALCAALPLPGLAQDTVASGLPTDFPPIVMPDPPTAEALFDAFSNRCQTIDADLETAIKTTYDSGSGAVGAITTDKAAAFFEEWIELPPGGNFAQLSYVRDRLPGGGVSYCSLNFSLNESVTPIAFTELRGVIKARAEGLLGAPTTQWGSDLSVEGEGIVGQMLLWTAGDSPNDPTVRLFQTSNLVQLELRLPRPPT
ncbi:hypothetical protein [Tabrizicola sp.]|uniref:hypothetical protein n=1 Tax=Tabrizicola sp. TaxID=2005166 RepID=UPI003F2E75CC